MYSINMYYKYLFNTFSTSVNGTSFNSTLVLKVLYVIFCSNIVKHVQQNFDFRLYVRF